MSLSIPTRSWANISIDFILRFPSAHKSMDSIFVIVDRFSKKAHFIAFKKTIDAMIVAHLFFKDVYRLHGLSSSIVFTWDTWFFCHFWRMLWKLNRPHLNFRSTDHPQTNGQAEVVKCSLGNQLRNIIGDNLKMWDQKLYLVEFAYNWFKSFSSGLWI